MHLVLNRRFRRGRQEDAHEFLRYLLDAIQTRCLSGLKNLDHRSKATTMVHGIFGGRLRRALRGRAGLMAGCGARVPAIASALPPLWALLKHV